MRRLASLPRASIAVRPGGMLLLLLTALSVANARRPAMGQPAFSGARSAALAGVSTALPDAAAAQDNPAAWGRAGARTLALHSAQLYGLPELRFAAIRFVAPAGESAIAAGASAFGFDLYRHFALEAGFGRGFGFGTHRRIHAGVRAGWNQTRVANGGQSGALGLTAGALLPITPFVSLGVVAYNLAAFGPLRPDLRRSLAVGAAWRPSESFALSADAAKEARSPLSIGSGVEIRLIDALALRGGAASGPRRASGGIGLTLASVRIDLAAQRHETLGWTPSMSLIYSW